jgi:hypothetical protein
VSFCSKSSIRNAKTYRDVVPQPRETASFLSATALE